MSIQIRVVVCTFLCWMAAAIAASAGDLATRAHRDNAGPPALTGARATVKEVPIAGYMSSVDLPPLPSMPSAVSPDYRDPIIEERNRIVRKFPLHWAAIQDQSDVIDVLVRAGRAVDSRDDEGRTPLMSAAAFGSNLAAKTLLALGADIDARDHVSGDSALHYSARFGRIEIATMLLDNGGFADVRSEKTGIAPMHYAAAFGHAAMIEYLASRGADPNATDNDGVTPIFYASRRNRFPIIELMERIGGKFGGLDEAVNANDVRRVLDLISGGSEVNSQSLAGRPIHLAATKGFLAIVRILVDHGADIDANDGFNRSTPLHLAAMADQPAVIDFLVSRGADVEARDIEGRTPLFVAASFGSGNAAGKLVSLGADINAFDDNYGLGPLHIAASHGHAGIVKLLISSGADVNMRTSTTRQSPLHFASSKDRADVARVLLDNGANINQLDASGKTPLTMFHRGSNVVKILDQMVLKNAHEDGNVIYQK